MNKYLEKIAALEKEALTRAVKEFAKGTIKTGLGKLVDQGVFRPAKVYAKGMAKGNTKLMQEANASIHKGNPVHEVSHAIAVQGGGFANLGSPKR